MSEPRLTERPLLTRARIGVLMGGQSAERDVSLRTGAAVHRSLVRRGYNAVTIDVGPTLSQDLRDQKIAWHFSRCMDRAGKMERFKDSWKLWEFPTPDPASRPVRSACIKSPRKHSWLQRVFLCRLARS